MRVSFERRTGDVSLGMSRRREFIITYPDIRPIFTTCLSVRSAVLKNHREYTANTSSYASFRKNNFHFFSRFEPFPKRNQLSICD